MVHLHYDINTRIVTHKQKGIYLLNCYSVFAQIFSKARMVFKLCPVSYQRIRLLNFIYS